MNTKNFITGVLVAAAAGALVGILFAPDKGSETRKKIKQKGSDLADEVKAKANSVANEMKEKFNAAKGEVSDLIAKGKEKVQSYKDEAKANLS